MIRLFSLFIIGLCLLNCQSSQEFSRSGLPTQSIQEAAPKDRLMVYQAYLTLRVKDAVSVSDSVAILLPVYDAYLASSNGQNYTIRVPSDNYQDLLTALSEQGKVEHESQSAQDVTDNYRDIEVQLETLERTRERYLQLLNKAEQVSEILEIEKELGRVNLELDRLKAQIQRFDNQITYATITLNLEEKVQPGPLGYVGLGIYKVVKWLFVWN